MNPRSTGILVLVALALGAFVYFYEIQGADRRHEAEELQKRLFSGVEQGAIEWISVDAPGAPQVRVERKDGKWQLVAPLSFPADAGAADGMASTLATLASESVLEEPQPPAEYGLAESARVVRFSAGGKEHELRLGKDAPIGQGAYASTDSGAIYTIARFKAASLAKPPDELREHRVLDFDREAIRKIEASWPGGRVVLEREPEKPAVEGEKKPGEEDSVAPLAGWQIVEPVKARADSQTLDDLLADLSFLRAAGFVDNPPSDAEAGLVHPVFEIALTAPGEGPGAAPRVIKLAIGAEHEGATRLARGAQSSLYTIAKAQFDRMPRTLSAWRWKQLAQFSLADAQGLDFFFQPPSGDPVVIRASRADAGWSSSPEAFAAGKIDAAVAALSHLRAEDIAADSMGEKELRGLGLAPPNAVVTVFGAAPAGANGEPAKADAAKSDTPPSAEGEAKPARPVLAEVQIGNVDGSEWIAARAAGDPTVYKLPYALAEQLPVSLDAFRNRFKAAEGAPEPAEPPAPAPGAQDGDFLPPNEESP